MVLSCLTYGVDGKLRAPFIHMELTFAWPVPSHITCLLCTEIGLYLRLRSDTNCSFGHFGNCYFTVYTWSIQRYVTPVGIKFRPLIKYKWMSEVDQMKMDWNRLNQVLVVVYTTLSSGIRSLFDSSFPICLWGCKWSLAACRLLPNHLQQVLPSLSSHPVSQPMQ